VNVTVGSQVMPSTIAVRRSYLYVANSNAPAGTTPPGGGDIAVYTFGASNNATPARVISGPSTGLSNPVQPLLDASGNLYVLDNGPYITSSNPVINVYAPGANGNAVPSRQITNIAAATSNLDCETMIFDPTGQYLFVMCDDGGGTIHVFPTTFTGAVPALSLQTATILCDSFAHPIGQAFDALGDLYVADAGVNAIFYFPAPLPTSGSYVPILPARTMNGGTSWPANVDPVAVGVDNAGTLYASILYFNSTAGGPDSNNQIDMWNTTSIPCTNCGPSASLIGGAPFVHAPAGLGLDAAGNLYTSNPFNNTIVEFARSTVAGASIGTNNPPVLRMLNTGASPGAPTGIAIGP
jgi:hypothetical protein